jgi:hypothetical protein
VFLFMASSSREAARAMSSAAAAGSIRLAAVDRPLAKEQWAKGSRVLPMASSSRQAACSGSIQPAAVDTPSVNAELTSMSSPVLAMTSSSR